MSHSNVDEAVATEAVDVATLVAENASLRDRLLRALADAENTRRRAESAAAEARKYAIADFGRELLAVADNLQRTIAAASRSPETVEDQALIEGVRATERLLEHTFSRFGIQKIDALGNFFQWTAGDFFLPGRKLREYFVDRGARRGQRQSREVRNRIVR